MARAHRLDPRALFGLSLLVVAVGLGLSSPPINGDVVVYAEQLDELQLFARWSHVGWIVASLPARVMWQGLQALQLTSAALVLWGAYRWRARPLALAGLAAVVAPLAAFGEVEPGWVMLGALALATDAKRKALVLWGLSVAVSPVALLMCAAASLAQRRWAPMAAGLAAVLVLILVSGGDWLWGNRGVLSVTTQPWLVGRTATEALWFVARLPLLWLTWRSRAWWVAPIALGAPPDVPVLWGIAVVALWDQQQTLQARWRRWMWAGLMVQALLALGAQIATHDLARRREAYLVGSPCADAVAGSWTDHQLARRHCATIVRVSDLDCAVDSVRIAVLPSEQEPDGAVLVGEAAHAVLQADCSHR